MKMSFFQIAVTGAFAFFIMLGVGVFALFTTGSNGGVGKVVIWGLLDQQTMDQVLQNMRTDDKSFIDTIYVQKKSATYESDLINAMASGAAPDLFLLTQDELGVFGDKIGVIPYSVMSQASYTASFVEESRLFLTPQGTLAMPLLIDPLVMYYNRDLLSSAGLPQPPRYWNDFIAVAPKITALDPSNNITKSAVALGQWNNVSHAKAILSALMMQAGDPIVARDSSGAPSLVFGTTPDGAAQNPAASALQFYTEFANPSKTTYSWNRSLPKSQDAFVSGDVAMYFGLASEYSSLAERNPNLHFGVAILPQIKGNSTQLTYGILTGLAVPRGAANPQGAVAIATKLAAQSGVALLSQQAGLPPVRTDVSEDTSGNAAASVFAQSALISRAWLDPKTGATDDIFKTMIESVVSGGATPDQAVREAYQGFQTLIRPNVQ